MLYFDRRTLLVTAVALAASRFAQAQLPAKPFRIGFATGLAPSTRQALLELMASRGWNYGIDFTFIDPGTPFSPDWEGTARKIVAERPDLIVVATSAAALAVHRLDSTTPIVMYVSGYPVEAGLAHSLARPGKNVTGNTLYAGAGVWGKLFQLLQDAKPGTRRIALLWGYSPPAFPVEEAEYGIRELRADARKLTLDIQFFEVKRAEDLQPALGALEAWKPEAVLISGGPFISPRLPHVMKSMIGLRVPTITDSHYPGDLEFGPLLVYAPPLSELRRQTVAYIDRIMRGAKAGDLPIQLPARYDLLVNLKTAKAIDLPVPRSLVLRADRVIE